MPSLAKKLLVIDDDNDYQFLISEKAKELGAETVPCLFHNNALEEIRKNPFDAILVDFILPTHDGFEVIEQLRDWLGSKFPIWMLSTNTPEQMKILAKEKGKDYVLNHLNGVLWKGDLDNSMKQVVLS